jgi:hypothetical protein
MFKAYFIAVFAIYAVFAGAQIMPVIKTMQTYADRSIPPIPLLSSSAIPIFAITHNDQPSCYYFGDRPQRAVQVGTTGLSYLKYVDATSQGFDRITNAHPPPNA